MSTENAIETEIKLAVPTWSAAQAQQRLLALGFQIAEPRVFEANFVYDTADHAVRSAQMLIRLRRVGARNVFTWKGPPKPGPHKSRPELEVTFDQFETMHQILGHLGYATYFQYEKYRTEFVGSGPGTITFDETPIGNFLELEGEGPWIDATAEKLGFTSKDYIVLSYGGLYLAHCANLGVQPLNMVFLSER